MFHCYFELNGIALSHFKILGRSFPAFSGHGSHVNSRLSSCVPGFGPIPPGRYYIFDRQGGGHLEWLRNSWSDHSEWFALYADDGSIDDETYCNQLKRGSFRLHPKGAAGISKGCITIENRGDFGTIRSFLKSAAPSDVAGSQLKAYGKLHVR